MTHAQGRYYFFFLDFVCAGATIPEASDHLASSRLDVHSFHQNLKRFARGNEIPRKRSKFRRYKFGSAEIKLVRWSLASGIVAPAQKSQEKKNVISTLSMDHEHSVAEQP